MSEFLYKLDQKWIDKVKYFDEFALGGMQVTIRLRDGRVYKKILISNCQYIVAIRGFDILPFSLSDIDDIYQSDEDKNPSEKGNWKYWDEWERPKKKF